MKKTKEQFAETSLSAYHTLVDRFNHMEDTHLTIDQFIDQVTNESYLEFLKTGELLTWKSTSRLNRCRWSCLTENKSEFIFEGHKVVIYTSHCGGISSEEHIADIYIRLVDDSDENYEDAVDYFCDSCSTDKTIEESHFKVKKPSPYFVVLDKKRPYI